MYAIRCIARLIIFGAPLLLLGASPGVWAISGGTASGCATGVPGKGEPTLQGVFDSILPSGTIDAARDCLPDAQDSLWNGMQVVATIVAEWAGNANFNEFGIYEASNPDNRVTVFDGPAGGGAVQPFSLSAAGDDFAVLVGGSEVARFATPTFGFFLATPAGTFFSDSALNPKQADQMYAYAGGTAAPPFTPRPGLAGRSFAADFFLLAFEDLPAWKSDRDFQDFIVLVEFAAPIPLPASAWLLLGACGVLIGLQRRRRRARAAAAA